MEPAGVREPVGFPNVRVELIGQTRTPSKSKSPVSPSPPASPALTKLHEAHNTKVSELEK